MSSLFSPKQLHDQRLIFIYGKLCNLRIKNKCHFLGKMFFPLKSSYKNPQMTQIDADKNKKEPENLARIVGEIGFYLWKPASTADKNQVSFSWKSVPPSHQNRRPVIRFDSSVFLDGPLYRHPRRIETCARATIPMTPVRETIAPHSPSPRFPHRRWVPRFCEC